MVCFRRLINPGHIVAVVLMMGLYCNYTLDVYIKAKLLAPYLQIPFYVVLPE